MRFMGIAAIMLAVVFLGARSLASGATTAQELAQPIYVADTTCPAPAPPRVDPTSMQDRAAILSYARSLSFHPANPPTGQTRRLTRMSRPGPENERRFALTVRGEVQPEACSHLNDATDLGPDQGRIVAKITMAGNYDKLLLPPGVSYLWVDNLVGSTARGVIVPGNLTDAARVLRVRFEAHPEYPQRSFAEARWLFRPNDDEVWASCARFGCCYLLGR